MWIARDKNGWLCIFSTEPHLDKAKERWEIDSIDWCGIDEDLFPEVTFENSPKELVIKD